MSGGVRGGKNQRAATIELGPAPEPDLFNESTFLQMFNAVMREHEGGPLKADHMAHAIVRDEDICSSKNNALPRSILFWVIGLPAGTRTRGKPRG